MLTQSILENGLCKKMIGGLNLQYAERHVLCLCLIILLFNTDTNPSFLLLDGTTVTGFSILYLFFVKAEFQITR
jgi:hypothetical protein